MSDPEKQPEATEGVGAHQPDGTDSSAQFQAGIADENMIPDAPGERPGEPGRTSD